MRFTVRWQSRCGDASARSVCRPSGCDEKAQAPRRAPLDVNSTQPGAFGTYTHAKQHTYARKSHSAHTAGEIQPPRCTLDRTPARHGITRLPGESCPSVASNDGDGGGGSISIIRIPPPPPPPPLPPFERTGRLSPLWLLLRPWLDGRLHPTLARPLPPPNRWWPVCGRLR